MEQFTLNDLSFTYSGAEKPALRHIDLTILEGEFVILCGRSGCGKSTLLRQFKTALKPHGLTEGNVCFYGQPMEDISPLEQAQKIGFVTQSPENQTITDTVRHELAFVGEGFGWDQEKLRRRMAESAALFDLQELLDQKTAVLSGGQKQLLNLAAVTITNPCVLIFDEPASQLDPVAADRFYQMLRSLNEELGITVIISDHSPGMFCRGEDRLLLLEDGVLTGDTDIRNGAALMYHQHDPMLYAMPTPLVVSTLYHGNAAENSPVTMGSGRAWLRDTLRIKQATALPEVVLNEKSEPAVEVKKVWFRYERNSVDILCGLSLKAYSGEILAITGGNGTGKSTLLQLMAGLHKPYSGKLHVLQGNRCAYLPQDPKLLLTEDTLLQELYGSLWDTELTEGQKQQQVNAVARLMGLTELLSRHPYDLSGGEQQKAAFAKLLLRHPSVLLMDEPVKGLDMASKQELGAMLQMLAKQGLCVVFVSHDMDFCAEYAHRCTMLFDGVCCRADHPGRFFSENSFYTTGAARMAQGMIERAVTVSDILSALGKPPKKEEPKDPSQKLRQLYEMDHKDGLKKPAFNKQWVKRILPGIIPVCLFLASMGEVLHLYRPISPLWMQLAAYGMILLLTVWYTVRAVQKRKGQGIHTAPVRDNRRYSWWVILSVFIMVPLTIFLGVYCFQDEKYLFISLLILLECTLPFFAVFEKKPMRTRELVLIAVMCAAAVTSRAVFYMLPEFKPLTAVVIITGAALGSEAGFMTGSVSMLVSNILFGQGAWTPWQMFAMGLIGFLAGVIFHGKRFPVQKDLLSVFGFISAIVIYGGIMDPAAMIISHIEPNWSNLLLYYASGLPVNIVHGISTALFLYLGGEAVVRKIERIKTKYGLISVVEELA